MSPPTTNVPFDSILVFGPGGGGGATVTVTVFVPAGSVEVTVVAVGVDPPPQPDRTIATPAMAAVVVRTPTLGVCGRSGTRRWFGGTARLFTIRLTWCKRCRSKYSLKVAQAAMLRRPRGDCIGTATISAWQSCRFFCADAADAGLGRSGLKAKRNLLLRNDLRRSPVAVTRVRSYRRHNRPNRGDDASREMAHR